MRLLLWNLRIGSFDDEFFRFSLHHSKAFRVILSCIMLLELIWRIERLFADVAPLLRLSLPLIFLSVLLAHNRSASLLFA